MASLSTHTDESVPVALSSLGHSLEESDLPLAISPVVISVTNNDVYIQENSVNNYDKLNTLQQFQMEGEEKEKKPNTVRVKNYENLNWSLKFSEDDSATCNKGAKGLVPSTPCIKYTDVINFGRCSKSHNCVMCGLKGNIPSQNKDVCKSCDTVFWYHTKFDVVIKFCKGCKNFVTLSEFQEKPEASKCGKCRHRGRQNYFARKNTSPKFSGSSSPYTASEDGDSDFDGENNSAEMMLSAIHGVVSVKNRPPIAPRIPRSRSDEQSPSPRMSSLVGPTPSSLPRVAFSRSISDTSLNSVTGTPAVRGICLDLKDTPKPPSVLKNGSTPHSVKKSNKKLPDSLTNAMYRKGYGNMNKSSPRTVSFALTPSTASEYDPETRYAFDAMSSIVPSTQQERWDTGLGAKEWDPSANPLMGLAMLTEHLSSNFSPPSKKRTISQLCSPSSSSSIPTTYFPSMISGVSIPPSTSSVMSSSAYTPDLIDSLTKSANLKIQIPQLNSTDSEDDYCNSRLPPRKRQLQEQHISVISAGGYE